MYSRELRKIIQLQEGAQGAWEDAQLGPPFQMVSNHSHTYPTGFNDFTMRSFKWPEVDFEKFQKVPETPSNIFGELNWYPEQSVMDPNIIND